jgi:hypothetical protein
VNGVPTVGYVELTLIVWEVAVPPTGQFIAKAAADAPLAESVALSGSVEVVRVKVMAALVLSEIPPTKVVNVTEPLVKPAQLAAGVMV